MQTLETNKADHQNRAPQQCGVAHNRVGRWLRRWSPMLMAWVSGSYTAWGIEAALDGRDFALFAIGGIMLAAMSILLRAQPPIGGDMARIPAQQTQPEEP